VSAEPLAVMDALDRRELEERQAAVRALLRYPLLTASGPDPNAFKLVRRHASWLRDWFGEHAGWALRVDNGLARLQKRVPTATDSTRPARADRAGVPFSRRRYALVCLGLAVLERADAQVTLGQLAERVVGMAAEPAISSTGLTFTIATHEERADLVAVVRLLQSVGVLARVAGDEQDFVSAPTGDALYDVDRRALAGLLVTPRGASLVLARDFEDRIKALEDEPVADTAEARRRATRHALTRRLLDDPVVYADDLTEEQQSYLTSQRPFLVRRVCEATGWIAEVRAEGIALLDPTGDATDLRMPEEGTDGHATLLLAEYLAATLKERGPIVVSLPVLHARMASWARTHSSRWRKGTRDPGAEVELCATAIHRLAGLGLVRVCSEGVVPRAAVARFEYRPAVVQVPFENEHDRI
jgi:uncharacterized protein (TIGR02678 family)